MLEQDQRKCATNLPFSAEACVDREPVLVCSRCDEALSSLPTVGGGGGRRDTPPRPLGEPDAGPLVKTRKRRQDPGHC